MSDGENDQSFHHKLTLGVVKALEERSGICDVQLVDRKAVDRHVLVAWEQKYSCLFPEDLRQFYLSTDGFSLNWSIKYEGKVLPLGSMEINPLSRLIRLGGLQQTGGVEKNAPTLLDVESDDEDESSISQPRFDVFSRIFELDPTDGYGKVCLVFKDTRPGIPAQKPEIWFLDRGLQWTFLASSFMAYYRLMVMHLGLPQWHYAFTDIGLSPQAKQWFYMYSPTRLDLDEGAYTVGTVKTEEQYTSSQPLDVARIFKGKSDKKKLPAPQPVQNAKKKTQPLMNRSSSTGSAKSLTSITGSTSQLANRKS